MSSSWSWTAAALCTVATLIIFTTNVVLKTKYTTEDTSSVLFYHNSKQESRDDQDSLWTFKNSSHLQFLFDEYRSEVLYSTRLNIIQDGDRFYRLMIDGGSMIGNQFSFPEIDLCRASTLLNLFEVAQNDRVDIHKIYPNFREVISGHMHQLSVEPVQLDRSFSSSKGEVLIVYTTCNQLSMTILSLQFLRNTDKLADIIIVDDHSTDGTVEYLQKKGFAVVSKPKATGLTDSWNIGYRLAVALGYKHVIFTNNDVLLTAGAVHLMHYGLRSHSLVVPLTTDKGSGHHKQQSIMKAHRLPAAMSSFVDDYRNSEMIQENLLRRYVYVAKEKRRCPAEQSMSKDKPKFNGFCFAVDIQKIDVATFVPSVHLFDPGDRIVGQEDSLTLRMAQHKLFPILLHCTFVYHFKSVTVSAANFTMFSEMMRRYNATIIEKSSFPTVKIQFYDSVNNKMIVKSIDIREDLRWYHPSNNNQADMFNSMIKSDSILSNFGRVEDEVESLNIWQGLTCQAKSPDVLFPAGGDNDQKLKEKRRILQRNLVENRRNLEGKVKDFSRNLDGILEENNGIFEENLSALTTSHHSTGMQQLYHSYPQMSWNIRSNPYCVYPTQWPAHCAKLMQQKSSDTAAVFEPELYAFNKPSVLIIAIAMSDPVATPSAGDVFTAYELGNALQSTYAHVKVRYLRRGAQWYNPLLLHDVDVLITLLDQYDLTKTLSLYLDSSVPNYFQKSEFSCHKSYQIKPNLITIAWIRNWFHRWLTKPWIGNYDVILTSSQISKAFFDKLSVEVGLQSSCANACPKKADGYSSPILPVMYRATSIRRGLNQDNVTNAFAGMPTTAFTASSSRRSMRATSSTPERSNSGSARMTEPWYDMIIDDTSTTDSSTTHTAAPTDRQESRRNLVNSATTTTNPAGNNKGSSSSGKGSTSGSNPAHMTWWFYTPRLHVNTFAFPLATSISYIRAEEAANDTLNTLLFRKQLPSNSTLEAERMFKNVDYIFTGSYYNVYRRIMAFDPASLAPRYSGRIVGGGWNKAVNITQGWKDACVGMLPYETVKEAYKYVKIVIDDANHATYPWGSVNSRVFDALASGAMVLSNGDIGMEEVFGLALKRRGLTLPIFHNASELTTLLEYYLSHDTEREEMTQLMQNIILREHSYNRRAEQLANILETTFNMPLTRKHSSNNIKKRVLNQALQMKQKQQHKQQRKAVAVTSEEAAQQQSQQQSQQQAQQEEEEGRHFLNTGRQLSSSKPKIKQSSNKSPPAGSSKKPSKVAAPPPPSPALPNTNGICIGVRTTIKHQDWLPVFVRSLIVQHSKSRYRDKLPMQLFLVDTEAQTSFVEYLLDLADKHNERFKFPYVQIFLATQSSSKPFKNTLYGYDDTDRILEHMLSMRRCMQQGLGSNSMLVKKGGSFLTRGSNANNRTMTKLMLTSTKSRNVATNLIPSCEWLMFTNGDNMYNAAWFDTIAPQLLSNKVDIVGWDFITHHPRGAKNDTPNQVINIAFERGYLDLASVVLRAELFVKNGIRFLHEAAFTKDLFARDYFTVKSLLPDLPPERVKLIHQCLLLHQ